MQTRYVRAKALLEADLGDEMVALDVEGGDCLGFNSVAAEIWRLLETPRDLDFIQRELLGKYDVSAEECMADISSLLAVLEEMGLIRIMPSSAIESAC